MAQHFAEQLRGAPAVEQQVVHGPDQMMPVRAGAQQRQAHQRRPLQVEALAQVGGGKAVQLGGVAAGPVRMGERQPHRAGHPLQRLLATMQEAAAQAVVARERGLPCRDKARRIESVDIDAQLVGIGTALGRQHTVEEHAGLHRRERIEVLHLRGIELQRIES
nr:hypothetical protein [Cupriavidus taiwanensis]